MKDFHQREEILSTEVSLSSGFVVRYEEMVINGQWSQYAEIHKADEGRLTNGPEQIVIVGKHTGELTLVSMAGRRTARLSKDGYLTRVDAVTYLYDLGIGLFGIYRFVRDDQISSWLVGVKQEGFVGPDDQSSLSEEELNEVVGKGGFLFRTSGLELIAHDGLNMYLGMAFGNDGVLKIEDKASLDLVKVNRRYDCSDLSRMVLHRPADREGAESLVMDSYQLRNDIFFAGVPESSKVL